MWGLHKMQSTAIIVRLLARAAPHANAIIRIAAKVETAAQLNDNNRLAAHLLQQFARHFYAVSVDRPQHMHGALRISRLRFREFKHCQTHTNTGNNGM